MLINVDMCRVKSAERQKIVATRDKAGGKACDGGTGRFGNLNGSRAAGTTSEGRGQ